MDRSIAIIFFALLILVIVVIGVGVARNDLNYTAVAGGLFILMGGVLNAGRMKSGKRGEDE